MKKPRTYSAIELSKLRPLEDRIYRFRLRRGMEHGDSLGRLFASELIKEVEPLSNAKYVQFESYYNADVMPWSRSVGIRLALYRGPAHGRGDASLDAADLRFVRRNAAEPDGAPMRIVVPWKYGYKSAKSIVKIKFVAKQPYTTWMEEAPSEYGFYSNVNPGVDTVPWSQASERVIGAPIWKQRQPTQIFNGYGDQVASLYAGMDLKKYY